MRKIRPPLNEHLHIGGDEGRPDKRARTTRYNHRWPAFARAAEDDPHSYGCTWQGHLPWYQRMPASFVAANDTVALAEGLKADFQTRGNQIKANLGGNATTGQIAAALKQDALARLQRAASAVAPLPCHPRPAASHSGICVRGSRYYYGDGSTHNNQMFIALAC